MRTSHVRLIASKRNFICSIFYRRAIIHRWRCVTRDVLYKGQLAAISIQRVARGRAGRRRSENIREDKSLDLWSECKRTIRSYGSDRLLRKLESEKHDMSRLERYATLDEYARSLNLSYNLNRGPGLSFDRDERIVERESCIRTVSILCVYAGTDSIFLCLYLYSLLVGKPRWDGLLTCIGF